MVNYFKDHLRDHSLIARPLYQMVVNATKLINKSLIWNDATTDSFDKLKELVHNCQKLNFIDYSLKIIYIRMLQTTLMVRIYVKNASTAIV